jgi:hypothetical protein
VSHGRALAGGCFALALAGAALAGQGQAAPPAEGWQPFEARWSFSGRRQSVPVEGGGAAAVVEISGALVVTSGAGLGRGFEAEAIVFDDGEGASLGRCVWTDEHGDRLFSRLKGEPLQAGRRLAGTVTGGTGRYAGLEGEYAFTWQYVLPAEDGAVQGRTGRVEGRLRRAGGGK